MKKLTLSSNQLSHNLILDFKALFVEAFPFFLAGQFLAYVLSSFNLSIAVIITILLFVHVFFSLLIFFERVNKNHIKSYLVFSNMRVLLRTPLLFIFGGMITGLFIIKDSLVAQGLFFFNFKIFWSIFSVVVFVFVFFILSFLNQSLPNVNQQEKLSSSANIRILIKNTILLMIVSALLGITMIISVIISSILTITDIDSLLADSIIMVILYSTFYLPLTFIHNRLLESTLISVN